MTLAGYFTLFPNRLFARSIQSSSASTSSQALSFRTRANSSWLTTATFFPSRVKAMNGSGTDTPVK
jgi:hypothetical protein